MAHMKKNKTKLDSTFPVRSWPKMCVLRPVKMPNTVSTLLITWPLARKRGTKLEVMCPRSPWISTKKVYLGGGFGYFYWWLESVTNIT